ncbi:caspase family protein [Actinocrispum sp. NPDC049592]|uniref:caspase family protein n=1 Tax=Actinocrispum sp. NPDC049592 TaxID=3154835 RepID=UPI00344ACB38
MSMRPSPELPPGKRYALVVATSRYDDTSLQQLRAPGQDAADLSAVLSDPRVGGFEVTTVVDRTEQNIRVETQRFLSNRKLPDLVLVYISCHGLLDIGGKLHFAATDTVKEYLAATGISAGWLLDRLDECRAKRQVVILDCCFSGKFPAGAKGPSELDASWFDSGQGRVVLTASGAQEYSYEGVPLDGQVQPGSVFTSALIDGIRTGGADFDADGRITIDDAFDYAARKMAADGANQRPQRSSHQTEGEIVLARNPHGIPLRSTDPWTDLADPDPAVRLLAIAALSDLTSGTSGVAAAARGALAHLRDEDDDAEVRAAAAQAWAGAGTTEPQPANRPESVGGVMPVAEAARWLADSLRNRPDDHPPDDHPADVHHTDGRAPGTSAARDPIADGGAAEGFAAEGRAAREPIATGGIAEGAAVEGRAAGEPAGGEPLVFLRSFRNMPPPSPPTLDQRIVATIQAIANPGTAEPDAALKPVLAHLVRVPRSGIGRKLVVAGAWAWALVCIVVTGYAGVVGQREVTGSMAVGFWELVLGTVSAVFGYGIVALVAGAVVYLISMGVMKLAGPGEVHTDGGMLAALGVGLFVLLGLIWLSLGGMVWMAGHQQPWHYDPNNSDQLTGIFLVAVTLVVIWLGACSGIAWDEGQSSPAGEKHRVPAIAAVVGLLATGTVVTADITGRIHGFWRGMAYGGAWAFLAFAVICLVLEFFDARPGRLGAASTAVAIAAGGSVAAYLTL